MLLCFMMKKRKLLLLKNPSNLSEETLTLKIEEAIQLYLKNYKKYFTLK